MAVKVEIIDVNLNIAKQFIAKNRFFVRGETTNRPISARIVNQYAIEMLTGNWKFTHQGIAFSKDGFLDDGQHRLLALIQAAEEGATVENTLIPPNPKIKIKFLVTYGLEKDVFGVMDTGTARTSRQILAMSGYINQSVLAAAGRLVYLFDNYEYRFWRSIKVTNAQILDKVTTVNLDQYVTTGYNLSRVGIIASSVVAGSFICQRALPSANHDLFLEKLKEGNNLELDDPILVLRNAMIRSKNNSQFSRRNSDLHLALYIKTWNDYVRGKRRASIAWNRMKEKFPTPVTENDKND